MQNRQNDDIVIIEWHMGSIEVQMRVNQVHNNARMNDIILST